MTILDFPVQKASNVTRTLRASVAAAGSPFTGGQQVQDWGGEWWEYQIDMAVLRAVDGRSLSAFLAQLGGQRGRFLFRDPTIRNTASVGAPVVSGAGQAGNALVTSGWNASPAIYAGDFISIGTGADTRLHQLTADVTPDNSGNATLQIVPRLRPSPADGAAIETANPAVLLRATGPVPTAIDAAHHYRVSLTAREAL